MIVNISEPLTQFTMFGLHCQLVGNGTQPCHAPRHTPTGRRITGSGEPLPAIPVVIGAVCLFVVQLFRVIGLEWFRMVCNDFEYV